MELIKVGMFLTWMGRDKFSDSIWVDPFGGKWGDSHTNALGKRVLEDGIAKREDLKQEEAGAQ